MSWYAGLNRLRDVLADLYPAVSIARVVVAEAGIAEQLIEFNGSAVEFWKSILSMAQNNGQVQDLINVARNHFPQNAQLAEAERIFQETPIPELPGIVEKLTPDRSGDGAANGGGNTTIHVGGNNSGMIAGRDVKNAKIQTVGHVTGHHNVIGMDSQVTIDDPSIEDEAPSPERFQQMILELKAALEGVAAQTALLAQIDPAAPFTAPGAAQHVGNVASDLQTGNGAQKKGIQEHLQAASTLIEGILDKAKNLAVKTSDTGQAVARLVEQLSFIATKLGVAIVWAAKLWSAG